MVIESLLIGIPLFLKNFVFYSYRDEFTLMVSCSVMSSSLRPHGYPVHGDSPGSNAGVGFHALFQGLFPTQVSCLAVQCANRLG